MGNVEAKPKQKRKPAAAQQWDWEFKNGRAFMKPRNGQKKEQPKRPLFKRQPSDNYNLWIFNPDPPKRRNSISRR